MVSTFTHSDPVFVHLCYEILEHTVPKSINTSNGSSLRVRLLPDILFWTFLAVHAALRHWHRTAGSHGCTKKLMLLLGGSYGIWRPEEEEHSSFWPPATTYSSLLLKASSMGRYLLTARLSGAVISLFVASLRVSTAAMNISHPQTVVCPLTSRKYYVFRNGISHLHVWPVHWCSGPRRPWSQWNISGC